MYKAQILCVYKIRFVAVLLQKIFKAEFQSKSLLSPPQRGSFFGGWPVLKNNEANGKKNVIMATSWVRTVTNRKMVEVS